MKRVYKNNDITFNLSINKFPFDSDIIKGIDFKFFTKNEKNCIRKTKEDIVNGSLILEWKELANLEEGIMYYTYNVSVTDSSFSDNENNTVDKVITDYFIMSGKTGIDCKQDGAVWGLIEGDVANLKDLVAYIDLTIKNLNKTYYNKNEIDIKESLLKQETATKQEQLISGTNIKTINGESILGHTDIKVATQGDIDKTNILIKQVAQTKANKSYVDEVATNKLDKSNAVGTKYLNAEGYEQGEVFNDTDTNKAEGFYSHSEGQNTTAYDFYSHAEGQSTTAYGGSSHAEGSSDDKKFEALCDWYGYDPKNITKEEVLELLHDESIGLAYGASSHSEGGWSSSVGDYSHAEGMGVKAFGKASHAEGEGTLVNNEAEHAEGKYNNSSPNTISSVGIGENDGYRKNAVEIMKDGKAYFLDLGGYNGRINPLSKSIQEVVNAKADKEYITTLENRLKAVEDNLNLGFITLEDGSGRIIPE